MFYAVDGDGSEWCFEDAPFIAGSMFKNEPPTWDTNGKYKQLELGSIEKITGKKIAFEDGFLEVKDE